MRRRDFIILGSAAAAPLLASPRAAHAQQPQRTRRIAALMTLTSDDQEGQARLKELRKGLETHGWSEGRNIQLDVRWAGADTKRLQVDAAELIKLKPEVVVAGGSRALIALQELTKETPIVFEIGRAHV